MFCNFLALVLKAELEARIAAPGQNIEDVPPDELKRRALRNDFDALAIVAPPKALGVLKKCLHKEVEKRVICTIDKEMTGRPIPHIEAMLDGQTRAEELPTV